MNKDGWRVIISLGGFLIILFCTMFLTTSCEGYAFSEDCENDNKFLVSVDWNRYNSQVERPEHLDLYLYDGERLISKNHIDAQGSELQLAKGSFRALACNNASGLMLQNMDRINSAEVAFFTTREGDELWMEQPAMFVLDNNIMINEGQAESVVVTPVNTFKEVSFSFVITNLTERKIKYLLGDLSGMATKMNLISGKILHTDFARQKFAAISSPETPAVYEVQFYSMEFIPKQVGQKTVRKNLTLNVEYTNGEKQTTTLDLSEYLDQFRNNEKISGRFEVVVSSQNLDLRFEKDIEN